MMSIPSSMIPHQYAIIIKLPLLGNNAIVAAVWMEKGSGECVFKLIY